MKRKDFLRRMRSRRRGDEIQLREPEQRRAIDWRTHRVELPEHDSVRQEIPVGMVELLPTGVRLVPNAACWVRGYRLWRSEEGTARAEFQYRPVPGASAAPPGSVALAAGDTWEPSTADSPAG